MKSLLAITFLLSIINKGAYGDTSLCDEVIKVLEDKRIFDCDVMLIDGENATANILEKCPIERFVSHSRYRVFENWSLVIVSMIIPKTFKFFSGPLLT